MPESQKLLHLIYFVLHLMYFVIHDPERLLNQQLPLKWECDCKLCANRCEWENLCHIHLWLTFPLSDCDASSVSSVCSYAGALRNMKQTEPQCRLLSALLKCHQAKGTATSRAKYFFAFVRQGKSTVFQITCELMQTNWFYVKPRICFLYLCHSEPSVKVTLARSHMDGELLHMWPGRASLMRAGRTPFADPYQSVCVKVQRLQKFKSNLYFYFFMWGVLCWCSAVTAQRSHLVLYWNK